MINTSYAGGLASYLSSNSSDDLLSILSKRAGLGTSGSGSSKTHLTIDTVNKLTDPAQKITYAGQLASTLQVASDAAASSGNTARLKEITAQAQKIMTAINDAVTKLQAKDTKAKAGQANAGVKTCQASISTAMTSLHSVLESIGALADKVGGDTGTATKTTLRTLDTTASNISTLAGTSWKSVFKNGTSVTGTKSASSSLIDYFA